ncbi:MAG: UDP-N-acetylmuramate--L-alanine ligase [Saprospiraceae bacterium]
MTIKEAQHIYFIGIGGIGMSAIARYFVAQGKKVSGYDKTQTSLTSQLSAEGIDIHFEDHVSSIPNDIDMVIFTPAIPHDHVGYNHLLKSGIMMIKRSEALGLISNEMKSIGIAGTHGKTTTSSMVTHVLKVGGIDVSAFLGGITIDYQSNCIIGKSDVVVLEADEYDRSFLRLSPYIASISSMDPDHLDIYGDHDGMKEGFKSYADKVRDGGHLIIREGLLDDFRLSELGTLVRRGITIYEYGDEKGQILFQNITVKDGRYVFDYQGLGKEWKEIVLNLPGSHNVENACVAVTIGILCGVVEDKIREALAGFKGIQRRFERIIETKDVVYIDDYAHHPGELKVAIDAARTLYPVQKITGIFQPHLYSRTRDFAAEFADELSKLDEVILMDIYPARELPMDGVDARLIFDMISQKNKYLVDKESLMPLIHQKDFEVLLTLGAGDIDTFVQKIKEHLQK